MASLSQRAKGTSFAVSAVNVEEAHPAVTVMISIDSLGVSIASEVGKLIFMWLSGTKISQTSAQTVTAGCAL